MHAALLDDARLYKQFDEIYRTEAIHTLPLVTYTEPRAETYNLLQQNVSNYLMSCDIDRVKLGYKVTNISIQVISWKLVLILILILILIYSL